jgi:RNA polymerase sigma factor (sigma-70 family)
VISLNEILELYQNNIKLTTYVAKKWLSGTPQILHDEILAEARTGLWKACKKFDPSRGCKFSTYATPTISNQIGMFMRKQKRHENVVSADIPVSEDENISLMDVNGYEHDFDTSIILREIISEIDSYPFTKLILKGLNQRQIASATGYSQSYISRLIRKERMILVEKYKVLAG